MKLKNLLSEDVRGQKLNLEKTKELYRENCQEHSFNNTQIYRGVSGQPEFYYLNPSKNERSSPSSAGYYSLIMDNSGFWSGYPKRSKSIICSTSQSYASSFGTPYLVVPYDSSNFGVCPNDDIWRSFNFSEFGEIGDLMDFDNHLNKISEKVSNEKLETANFNKFRSQIIELGRKVVNNSELSLTSSLLKKYLNSSADDLFFYIERLLDPEKNGFKTKEYTSNFNLFGNREIWSDGEFLLIQHDLIDSFKQKSD